MRRKQQPATFTDWLLQFLQGRAEGALWDLLKAAFGMNKPKPPKPPPWEDW